MPSSGIYSRRSIINCSLLPPPCGEQRWSRAFPVLGREIRPQTTMTLSHVGGGWGIGPRRCHGEPQKGQRSPEEVRNDQDTEASEGMLVATGVRRETTGQRGMRGKDDGEAECREEADGTIGPEHESSGAFRNARGRRAEACTPTSCFPHQCLHFSWGPTPPTRVGQMNLAWPLGHVTQAWPIHTAHPPGSGMDT